MIKVNLKKVALILAVFFVLIQFYPLKRPVVKMDNLNDFIVNNKVPKDIAKILKTSCYDCHSNETNYPWYAKVAPVKWLVFHDTNEGREELNFSNWKTLSNDDKADVLFDVADVVREKDMPMPIYLTIHSDAKLTKEQRAKFAEWFDAFAEEF